MELLNETSFDRRRQVAVYKNDGKRGHHMQARPPAQASRQMGLYTRASLAFGVHKVADSALRQSGGAWPVCACALHDSVFIACATLLSHDLAGAWLLLWRSRVAPPRNATARLARV